MFFVAIHEVGLPRLERAGDVNEDAVLGLSSSELFGGVSVAPRNDILALIAKISPEEFGIGGSGSR